RTVARRMLDSGWAFLRRAGTLILASMILVWALLYFPRSEAGGESYDVHLARLQQERNALRDKSGEAEEAKAKELQEQLDEQQATIDEFRGEWNRQASLGRRRRPIAPAVRPLGWDWKIGMAALASFPAREVVVGTLGVIYNRGKTDSKEIRESSNVAGT